MKKLLIISIICLFSLQCEKGWLREILNPTVEGCNIPTACNYNPDVNKFDDSCEYASCIDCLGIAHGVSTIDSCGTCDAVASNNCKKDCAGVWGGYKILDCNDVCGGAFMLDNCNVCDDDPFNDCEADDCNGVANGNAFIDPHYGEDNCTVNECVRGNTGFEPCEKDCFDRWGGSAEIDICGVCNGDNDCESIDCTVITSAYCTDLSVLQDFIDLNTSLSAQNPLEIGEQVWTNGRLRSLTLSNSQIADLPNTIENLTALIELNLISNQFTTLPQSICNLSDECIINVGNNQLCEESHFNCIDYWGGQNQSNCESSLECIDIDGNVYKTIQIGDQLWMAENLKVTHYQDGTDIQFVQTETFEHDVWENISTGAYAIYPTDEDVPSTTTCGDDCADVYGNLYNWYTVDDDGGLCPEGWHVPSDAEWTTLITYFDKDVEPEVKGWQSHLAGCMMKDTGTIEGADGLWYLPNTCATNESGFTAYPGGWIIGKDNGLYDNMGSVAIFWSSTESSSGVAWIRNLVYSTSFVGRFNVLEYCGFSVRCVGDN